MRTAFGLKFTCFYRFISARGIFTIGLIYIVGYIHGSRFSKMPDKSNILKTRDPEIIATKIPTTIVTQKQVRSKNRKHKNAVHEKALKSTSTPHKVLTTVSTKIIHKKRSRKMKRIEKYFYRKTCSK